MIPISIVSIRMLVLVSDTLESDCYQNLQYLTEVFHNYLTICNLFNHIVMHTWHVPAHVWLNNHGGSTHFVPLTLVTLTNQNLPEPLVLTNRLPIGCSRKHVADEAVRSR